MGITTSYYCELYTSKVHLFFSDGKHDIFSIRNFSGNDFSQVYI